MADHQKPALTSDYTSFVSEMSARFNDLAVGLDPAVSTIDNPATGGIAPTALPTSSIRWSSVNNKWEKYNGTTWSDLSNNYAINITGTAATAAALATPRNINGVSFNGTSDISINLTNAITFNSSGAGATSNSTFNGGGAITVSHNTLGAAPLNGVGTSGSWPISITGNATTASNVVGSNQNTFTATQTFNGSGSQLAMSVRNIGEQATVAFAGAGGYINCPISTQSIIYYINAATNNWTIDFVGTSGGNSLNAMMAVGQSITVAVLATQGAATFYNTTVWIDGGTGGVTTRWQGGLAPNSGNANSVDVYSYTIIKTANATFSVFASQTRFG